MPVAFLVDGFTEQKFIQQICPSSPVQRLNLNGNTVSAGAIAKRVATQIRLWGGKFYPVVVLVDHEDRPVTHQEFSAALREELLRLGVREDVRVCVARRMIENWIIADSESIGWKDAPHNVDHLHGAGQLKKLVSEYDKAGDGPGLLRKARASKIAARSPSFADSVEMLRGLRCAWLTR